MRLRRDGSPVQIEVNVTVQYGEDGRPLTMTTVNRDMTERKNYERALNQQAEALANNEQEFRHLVEAANSIIIKADTEGTITFINDFGLRFFGYTEQELIGRKAVGTIIPPVDLEGQDLAALISDLAKNPQSYRVNVNENMKKDGTRVWISWSNKALLDEEGRTAGTLTVGNDITELKLSREELASFAQVVSHDLKSPLSAVNLANEVVLEEAAGIEDDRIRTEIVQSAGTIRSNVSRSYGLIDGLLALAEAGGAADGAHAVDVAGIVLDILSERSVRLNEEKVDVSVDPDLGLVTAHPLHVYQVFNNLIGNAIRHNTAAAPALGIHYRGKTKLGSHLYLVRDNGQGIEEPDLSNVFLPFFSLDKASSTGVGLSITRKILESYGGHIRAFNDGGACFEFSFGDHHTGAGDAESVQDRPDERL